MSTFEITATNCQGLGKLVIEESGEFFILTAVYRPGNQSPSARIPKRELRQALEDLLDNRTIETPSDSNLRGMDIHVPHPLSYLSSPEEKHVRLFFRSTQDGSDLILVLCKQLASALGVTMN